MPDFPFPFPGSDAVVDPDQRKRDFIANALIALGAGINHAGSQGRPFYEGIAPGAAIFAKGQSDQQQRDESNQFRNFQMGLHMQALRDKEATQKRLLAGQDAYASMIAPPGMKAPLAPLLGPGSYDARIQGVESGGRMIPNELGSGAFGPYQFMPDTWSGVRLKYPQLALPADMTQATKEQHKAAFDKFTADNVAALQGAGYQPTPDNLYLAHRFGAGGATSVLKADPNALLADVLPVDWQRQNPDMRGQTAGGFRRLAGERMGGVGDAPQPSGIVPAQYTPAGLPPASPPEVPRPQAPPEFLARQAALVRAGALTPQQSEAEINKMVDGLWQSQRETARLIWHHQQENFRHQRGLETEGEWVRGADGVERFTPKSQRSAGMTRTDKPPQAGTETGDVHILDNGDPSSREYAGAYNRVRTKPIDGPNGLKYFPDMSAYRAPAAAGTTPAPAANPSAVPGAAPADVQGGIHAPSGGPPPGLTQVGEKAYTESQNKDHLYAIQLDNAVPQLEKLLKDDKGEYTTANLPGNTARVIADFAYAPESIVTDKAKALRQLEQDIVSATLRLTSGAVIGSNEYEREKAKYIPQSTDSAAVIKQKIRALKLATIGIGEGSGRPIDRYPNIASYAKELQNSGPPQGPIKIDRSGRRQ